MSSPGATAHPYIPNSAPSVRAQMLQEIGAASVEELYAAIPEALRLRRPLAIPAAMDELSLRRQLEGTLARNTSTREALSFLGGGCWPHYVPATVDEVVNRAEFVTAYYGETYTDHGKMQALFEFASLIGELVELDAVSQPTYDWGSAAATAISMACRVSGRPLALVPEAIGRERRSIIAGYCPPRTEIRWLASDPGSGLVDREALRAALSDQVGVVYLEVPGYLGTLDPNAAEIGRLAHEAGALFVVGVDAVSLGVLAPPTRYGADVVCGEIQGLGIHQHFGGGLAGFVATPDTEQWVSEYPTFLVGLAPTDVEGEYGFGEVQWERMSYVQRGEAKEYAGTTQNLWAIGAAVYLSLLGPQGLAELGQGIAQRAQYAAVRLGEIPGVVSPALSAPFFKEFVVRFETATVAGVNARLRERGIFGGRDLSGDYPWLGQASLVCVTETHSQSDIDRLAEAVREVVA